MKTQALNLDREALLAQTLKGEFPDARGRFGPFGGRYVPETLVPALDRLEQGIRDILPDPAFKAELDQQLRTWVGPARRRSRTPPHLSKRWGAEVWLKREDLAHTGAHKINNAIGQGLLAKRLGAKRIVAETGAGQHGVATAAACARLGMPCTVYMGSIDMERQAPNVGRMKLLGANVVPVTGGDKTLRAAIDEALRDWVSDPDGTFYILGSAVGPHPYPYMVREFQRVIGVEARAQMLAQAGALPDVVVACVGGGSNAIGLFHPFVPDLDVKLLGFEAGGTGPGLGQNAASLAYGTPGVLQGCYSLLLQDEHGQIQETHSVSAGLDYPGVGPEHALLASIGRLGFAAAEDDESLAALAECSQYEGILPAIETAHAFAGARKVRPGESRLPHPDRPLRSRRQGHADVAAHLAQGTDLMTTSQQTAQPRDSISSAISQAAASGRPAVVGFMTAGFPGSRAFRGKPARDRVRGRRRRDRRAVQRSHGRWRHDPARQFRVPAGRLHAHVAAAGTDCDAAAGRVRRSC